MNEKLTVEEFFLGVERAASRLNYKDFCRVLGYGENEDMWNRWQKLCGAIHELDGEDVRKLIEASNGN